jgi:hypothetical protein
MKNDRYYYGLMSKEEQKVYIVIHNSIMTYSKKICINTIVEVEKVEEIYFCVLRDTPAFFYVNQRKIHFLYSPGYYEISPIYLYSKKEAAIINKQILNNISVIEKKVCKFRNDDFRLEKYLHDFLVKNVTYDYDSLKKEDQYDAHSIVGPFIKTKAVCEGIAKAFKLLCNYFDIKCFIVVGKAGKNNNLSVDSNHAWNIVKINDKSYHVDVTWDNFLDKEPKHISYDYFNITTKEILLDHNPTVMIPECNADDLNYFSFTNSIISTESDLEIYLYKNIQQKKIVFKFNRELVKTKSESQILNLVSLKLNSAKKK